MYADNLLELAENANPDADYRFKEELAKDRFLERVRCSDGCREQLFIKQLDSLYAAVCLVRQLETARVASRSSAENKPVRPQVNVVEESENGPEVAELKSLMVSINSLLERLEKQQQEQRSCSVRGFSGKCYRCNRYGHYARNCSNSSENRQGGLPRVDQFP